MSSNNTKIIDVRSADEFAMGHAENAINIPLNMVESKIEEISKMDCEIILCCASGNRSAIAQQLLQSKGINCHNAGSWFQAENYALAL